ncbi:hypothetical protein L1887_59863 [Cichorium endivia]|nr:hypothetical protein L1887_59863 [Cichorium endivia]
MRMTTSRAAAGAMVQSRRGCAVAGSDYHKRQLGLLKEASRKGGPADVRIATRQDPELPRLNSTGPSANATQHSAFGVQHSALGIHRWSIVGRVVSPSPPSSAPCATPASI